MPGSARLPEVGGTWWSPRLSAGPAFSAGCSQVHGKRLLAVVCAQGPRVPGCRRQALSSPHAEVGDSGSRVCSWQRGRGDSCGLGRPFPVLVVTVLSHPAGGAGDGEAVAAWGLRTPVFSDSPRGHSCTGGEKAPRPAGAPVLSPDTAWP